MKTAASRLPLLAGMMVLALLSITETGFARERAIEKPFYQNNNLYIAPESNATVERWCKQERTRKFGSSVPWPYGFIVRYTVDHEHRDALFSPDIEAFVLQRIVPAIKNTCGSAIEIPNSFHIHFQMSNRKKGGNDVIRDQLMFRYRNGKVIQTSYAPGAEMIQGKSTEEIEAMRNTVPKVLERLDTVVAKIGPFTIYPHYYPLCTELGIEVDAVFDIPAEQRDDWIEGKYGSNTPNNGYDLFFEKDVWPALKKSCGARYNRVRVHFFEEGSTDFYDMMAFKVLAPGYTKSKSYNGIIETHNMSKKAIEVATLKRNKELFGECTDGPFCDKLGGIYFNAIYRNDIHTVRRINAALNRKYKAATRFDLNFLVHLSGKYMYDYSQYAVSHEVLTGDRTSACFRAGAKTIDTRTVTEVINYEDQYGIPQGSAGGIEIGKKYRINPEFIGLSKRVVGPASGEMGDFLASYFNLEKMRAILSGLEQVISQTACESPELRQFERNLVSMTERSLRGWKDSPEPPVKTSATEVTAPQPVVVTPSSSSEETHSPAIDSSSDNSIAPTKNRQRIRSESVQPRIQQEAREQTVRNQRTRTTISPEKQQAMMAEVRAVTETMTKTQQATIQEFVTRLKNAGSTAERTKITQEMRAFQESSAQELQKAMAEIQQRYQ
ncbi:MAG: hypothetical protein KUF77_09820 [Candidatus Thiodiazotropha sp. (ex Lucina aurantia)]|nr:hypothetical protein [Candidatus Thiodiazotropha taylori]MBV2097820.1 hypothetical protein [Candidatus Thiodiazotropha sp. (ex Codakia orbicularis)]MBV2103307.1 hypothetical protein [Candidatus Thiodiazotropha sp. (ex Lucina aurantia)]MBV2116330.1 hypothetical protein [Candidatus Thiodiazotropha sp. (ex Lucina aurantia)]